MLDLYFFLTGLVVVAGTVWGVWGANDTLHPLVYLLPMAGFFYIYVPVSLYVEGGLFSYFTVEEITFVQGLNLACVTGLALGGYYGTKGVRRDAERVDLFSFTMTSQTRERLKTVGLVLGGVAVAAYVYKIANVGGFVAAYSHVKGGGATTSGYIRSIDQLAIPAIVCIYMSRTGTRLTRGKKLLVGMFSVPLLIHGLLSARRGPTFLALATLIAGWYLVRRKRPSLPTIAVGGTAVGLLLLALVTFRGQIYLGSSFLTGGPSTAEIVEKSLERSTRKELSNEYLNGAYIALNARDNAGHYWGKRYLTQLFVRPIPSRIWPTKYEDVGMEAIFYNAGQLRTADPEQHPKIPEGAAPGVAAGAYVELGWLAPVFLFLVGWGYALAWRRSLVQGGRWTVIYSILLSVSAYLVAQSFFAILYRVLLMVIPVLVLWEWFGLSPQYRLKSGSSSVSA